MVVKSSKPVFFAASHNDDEVMKILEKFDQAIKGKKKLFIELPQEYIDQVIKEGRMGAKLSIIAYQRLVWTAHNAGLEVIALDTAEHVNEEVKAAEELKEAVEHQFRFPNDLHNVDRVKELAARAHYLNKESREKGWIELLHGENSRSIVVTECPHTDALMERMGIPEGNILYPDLAEFRRRVESHSEARKLSREAAERIESARLKRARSRAQQRALRNRKPNSSRTKLR